MTVSPMLLRTGTTTPRQPRFGRTAGLLVDSALVPALHVPTTRTFVIRNSIAALSGPGLIVSSTPPHMDTRQLKLSKSIQNVRSHAAVAEIKKAPLSIQQPRSITHQFLWIQVQPLLLSAHVLMIIISSMRLGILVWTGQVLTVGWTVLHTGIRAVRSTMLCIRARGSVTSIARML